MIKTVILIFIITFLSSLKADENNKELIESAIQNQFRKKENIARDIFRNPLETLIFFGIRRDMKILEVVPGRGWYTEILANYMKNTDNFYVAKYNKPPFAVEIINKIQNEFDTYFSENEKNFGSVQQVFINDRFEIESDRKFDMILTFRNSHNWLGIEKGEQIYRSIYKNLKKGGILGVVQHRANETMESNFGKGYVKESFLIKFIEEQGFKFVEKSEINSNPKDLKNYEKGVWTLPPTFRLGEKDKSKFIEIGESDRMTLKFKK